MTKHERAVIQHYNLPDEYFNFLGEYRSYAGNMWLPCCKDNDHAFEHKADLYGGILRLQPTDQVLEIGCGYGAMAKYLSDNFGSYITATNISKYQHEYAKRQNSNVNYVLTDWHNLSGQYDKIYSDGCLVHQSDMQDEYFAKHKELLKEGGIAIIKEMHFREDSGVGEDNCRELGNTFGFAGQYRTLETDVKGIEAQGFTVDVVTIPIESYIKTQTTWQKNMDLDKDKMNAIDAHRRELDHKTWGLYVQLMRDGMFSLDIMICQKQ